jgi:hypothetical protein
MKRSLSVFSIVYALITVGAITYLLYLRYKLGQTRYFDIDEFAHLHWAFNYYTGLKPYTQFFYFFPPLFLLALRPIFSLVGQPSVQILLTARTVVFIFYVFSTILLFVLTCLIRGWKRALMVALFFVSLSLPSDKWLEIRPDGLATALTLLGMVFLVAGFGSKKRVFFVLSGFAYALSLGVVSKMLFFVGIAGITILSPMILLPLRETHPEGVRVWKEVRGHILLFAIGAIIPTVVILYMFFQSGDAIKAFTLTTTIASNATKVLGKKFFIGPNFYFWPNDVFYGTMGFSLNWNVNFVLWVLSIFFSIRWLFGSDKKRFLLSASFLVNLMAYVAFFPLKHAQYLVPLAPFVSYFAVEGVMGIFGRSRHIARTLRIPEKIILPIFSIFLTVILTLVFLGGKQMHDLKLRWNSPSVTQFYKEMYALLPFSQPILDLTGVSIFAKDPYYYCCLPYGQYEEALPFPIPSLEKALRSNQVPIVYTNDGGRLDVLPLQQATLIREHYVSDPFWGGGIFMVSGTKRTYPNGGEIHDFDLYAPGLYAFFIDDASVNNETAPDIILDGKMLISGTLYLSTGKHTLSLRKPGVVTVRYTW